MSPISNVPSPRALPNFGKRIASYLVAAFFVTLLHASASAQLPITYYDFENNTTRTTFENAVEQQVNSGNSTLTKVGLTTTITGATGAGTALHNTTGATAGTAINATTWSTVTTDPGTAATTYYQFTINTTGLSGISLSYDEFVGTTAAAFPCTGALVSTAGVGGPYSVLIAGTCGTNNTWTTKSANLPAAANNNASVVIRVYGYFSDGTANGVLRLDNITAFATAATASKTLLNEDNIFTSVTSGATGADFNRGNFTVNSGATVTLSSFVAIASGSTFTVASGGTLSFGSVFNAIFGAGNFTLNSGATILINSANGITSTANAGNVQVTGTRTFDPAANYTYNRNGTGAQLTGNQLPTTLTGNLTVALGASADSPLTLSQSMTQGGTGASLTLTSGTFSIGANTLTLNGAVSNSSTLSGGTGTIIVGGTISRTFSGAGNYNLNHLQITPSGSLTLNLSSNVTLHVAGNFTKNSGTTLQCNSTQTATSNTCTLDFNGGGTSSFSWVNNTIVPWNITVQTGTTVNVDTTNSSFTLRGNLGGGGTFTATTGTITINTVTTSTMAGTKTFNNLTTTTGVDFGTGTPTVNGIFQIDAGGFVANSHPPIYGGASTLKYNTGGSYGRGSEWSATSGAGYPFNVQLSNNTTLNVGANGGTATARQMAGTLTIDSGSTFQMAGANPMSAAVSVLGGVNINGALVLSTSLGGDIKVGGNWTRAAAGTFTPNSRAVFFNGSGAQSIAVTGGGIETFNYLIVDKPSGSLVISSSPATSVVVNGNSGNVLQLLNAGGLNMNGRGVTLQTDGGSVLVSGGVRTVTGGGGTFTFSNSKSVTSLSGGTLVFDSGVKVVINASVDFGASLTTVQGSLTIGSSGSVNTNPPTYDTNSTLVYDCGCVFHRGAEWSASSGPGYPFNVQINDTTANDLDLGSSTPGTPRQMAGNLVIKNGGNLLMDFVGAGGAPMTAALTVLGSVSIESGGSLHLSTSAGGDLHLQGAFTNNGTFTHNNRAVFFEGGNLQAASDASGTLTIPYVRVNKSGGTVRLDSNLTTLGPNGGDSLQFTGATSTLTLNGKTLTLGSTVGAPPAGSGLFGDAAATLSLQNGGATGAMGTVAFVSGGQTLDTLTINRTGGAGTATLGSDLFVGNMLNLTAGDIITGANTITMPNTANSTGTGDVVGNVKRTGFTNGPPLTAAQTFGNPNVQISFQTGTPPADVTVNLVKSRPTGNGFGFPNSVNRTYTVTPNGGSSFTATLRLHYLTSELSGQPPAGEEVALDLWRFDGTRWQRVPKTAADIVNEPNKWVESSAVTQFSPWVLAAQPLAPTAARLRSFNATRYLDGMLVEWQTGREVDNLGFNVYREDGRRRTLITPSLVAGSALVAGPGTVLTAGNTYAWVDPHGSPASRYWLEDVDTDGKRTMSGPFASASGEGRMPERHQSLLLSRLGAADSAASAQRQWSSPPPPPQQPGGKQAGTSLRASDGVEAASIERQRVLAAGPAVKLLVRRAGWYRVTRAQLEAAGLRPDADPARLQLYADGVTQALRVNAAEWQQNGAVEFYGEGLDTTSTDTRVYWLAEGAAQPAGEAAVSAPAAEGITSFRRPVLPPRPGAATSFAYTAERRERSIYFSGLLNGEAENFFGRVVSATPGAQTLAVRNLALGKTAGPASLEVALQGVTTGAHNVRVLFNGSEVGTLDFAGRTRGVATFPLGTWQLREGDNEVQLVSGAAGDVSLTDHLRLSYMHSYRADDDALRFTAQAGAPVRVGGFTSPRVRVVDVTDPANAFEVSASVTPDVDGYAVEFSAGGKGQRALLAFDDARVAQVEAALANQPSDWHDAGHEADFVIITHADFREQVAPLAEQREAEGLVTKVVNVEDLFDEYSFGAHSPQAVRDFLAATAQNWGRAPRYVLLVGDGSYDPRDHTGRGSFDLVPAKLVDTEHMETASDNWLADFDDDGMAEMAVGRLPVRTADEARLVVGKLLDHAPGAGAQSAVMVADRTGADGYSFEAATDEVQRLLPPALAVERINRGAQGADSVRSQIVAAVNAGPALVNWMGHGSVSVWTGEGLLRNQDAAALQNGARLPLFVMMTCLNGYYLDPSVDSLSEALMKAEGGGAIAAWTSTGMTEPEGQAAMNRELYRALFEGAGTLRLGDAMQRARTATDDADVRRTWVLIGDPTTRWR